MTRAELLALLERMRDVQERAENLEPIIHDELDAPDEAMSVLDDAAAVLKLARAVIIELSARAR